jgi:hypothetical protein
MCIQSTVRNVGDGWALSLLTVQTIVQEFAEVTKLHVRDVCHNYLGDLANLDRSDMISVDDWKEYAVDASWDINALKRWRAAIDNNWDINEWVGAFRGLTHLRLTGKLYGGSISRLLQGLTGLQAL